MENTPWQRAQRDQATLRLSGTQHQPAWTSWDVLLSRGLQRRCSHKKHEHGDGRYKPCLRKPNNRVTSPPMTENQNDLIGQMQAAMKFFAEMQKPAQEAMKLFADAQMKFFADTQRPAQEAMKAFAELQKPALEGMKAFAEVQNAAQQAMKAFAEMQNSAQEAMKLFTEMQKPAIQAMSFFADMQKPTLEAMKFFAEMQKPAHKE